MGVAGLWEVLKPAAKTRSLTELAVTEGFQANSGGLRGYRIGIDASIWFFHAEYGKEGENPVLRTLFFRCATLMKAPFLPLFVFDGPKRPEFKRGKHINKEGHKLIPGMKRIVEAFGFEWRMAPGEAEAELAYLNRIGVIDGILSDDVDTFLFGAVTVVRNQSNNLSGNKANPVLNSEGRDDKNHTRVFHFQDLCDHPDIQLTRGGLILMGLLRGGDYGGGLEGCGIATAHALARCGLGDSLYEAARNLSKDGLITFLDNWRQELRHELKTNSRGFMARKSVSLSDSIPDTFPSLDILFCYVQPITSESLGHGGKNPEITWLKEPKVASLAAACELYFEWGYKEAIIKRFRTVLWPGAVLRILRRAVLDVDETTTSPATPRKSDNQLVDEEEDYGTPSKMIAKHFSVIRLDDESPSTAEDVLGTNPRLLVNISLERTHASTDGLLEYRVEVAPGQLVRIAESGLKGLRQPEGPNEWVSEGDEDDDDDESGGGKKGKSKEPADPDSHLRLWMPACMVDIVEKKLVKDFRDTQERKKQRKKAPAKKKAAPKAPTDSPIRKAASAPAPLQPVLQNRSLNELSPQTPSKRKPHLSSSPIEARQEEEEETSEDEGELPIIPTITAPKRTATATRKSSSRSTSLSKVSQVAAIFDPSTQSSTLPSLRAIESTLALTDSEGELPADLYQIARPIKPTKKATTNRIQGYISLSDDDNHGKPNLPIKRTKATNRRQTTLAPYVDQNYRRKYTSQDEIDATRQVHKSPRKSRRQQSPRHEGAVSGKDSTTITISDDESDTGYSGISKPSVAPLRLARARVKGKVTAITSHARPAFAEQDVIDLT